jgi:Tfp pilus assembly ATPase PilU
MQTCDQSLAGLYRRGMIDRDAALANATFEPGLRVALETADHERAMTAPA